MDQPDIHAAPNRDRIRVERHRCERTVLGTLPDRAEHAAGGDPVPVRARSQSEPDSRRRGALPRTRRCKSCVSRGIRVLDRGSISRPAGAIRRERSLIKTGLRGVDILWAGIGLPDYGTADPEVTIAIKDHSITPGTPVTHRKRSICDHAFGSTYSTTRARGNLLYATTRVLPATSQIATKPARCRRRCRPRRDCRRILRLLSRNSAANPRLGPPHAGALEVPSGTRVRKSRPVAGSPSGNEPRLRS